MVIVNQTDFRKNQKKYLDLSKKERVVITQRGTNEVIELVRKEKIDDYYLTGEEFIKAVHAEIDKFPDRP